MFYISFKILYSILEIMLFAWYILLRSVSERKKIMFYFILNMKFVRIKLHLCSLMYI